MNSTKRLTQHIPTLREEDHASREAVWLATFRNCELRVTNSEVPST